MIPRYYRENTFRRKVKRMTCLAKASLVHYCHPPTDRSVLRHLTMRLNISSALVSSVPMVLRFALLIYGIYLLDRTLQFDSKSTQTTGTITSFEFNAEKEPLASRAVNKECFLIVVFHTLEEQSQGIRVTDDFSNTPVRCRNKVGDVVDVAYDPNHPSDAVAMVGWHKFRRPLFSYATPIAGAAFLVFLAVTLLRGFQPHQTETTNPSCQKCEHRSMRKCHQTGSINPPTTDCEYGVHEFALAPDETDLTKKVKR